MLKIKLSSGDWVQLTRVIVYDPDGWDRGGDFNADWAKPITFDEFVDKCSRSTVKGFMDEREMRRNAVKNFRASL